MIEEFLFEELCKLLKKSETFKEEAGCGERYMQDTQPKDKTQNQLMTSFVFVEITLSETEYKLLQSIQMKKKADIALTVKGFLGF